MQHKSQRLMSRWKYQFSYDHLSQAYVNLNLNLIYFMLN